MYFDADGKLLQGVYKRKLSVFKSGIPSNHSRKIE